MKTKTKQLIDEIGNYIQHLVFDEKLQICICDFKFPADYHQLLTSYGAHTNGYCRQIKSTKNGQKACWLMQKFVRAKCKQGKPFFGTCYAGVSEFVFPILENEKYYGFVSVSGYRLENRPSPIYQDLKKDLPDIKKISAQLSPLINSFKLLSHYVATDHEQAEDEGQVRVYSEILQFISQNYLQKLSLNEIAKNLHYTPSYIEHSFKKANGIPLMRYVRNLKIEKAKELLVTTNNNVLQISESVGFEDSNYFTAVFKKTVGLSPRAYRNKNL